MMSVRVRSIAGFCRRRLSQPQRQSRGGVAQGSRAFSMLSFLDSDRSINKMTCIEDLHQVYKRRVPKMFYDYCESGSWTEQTFRENKTDFERIRLRQKVACDMSNRSLKTTMVGQDVSMPLALAPVGFTGMNSADGEIKAARACEEAGVPFTLSTMSICSIEHVAENTSKPFWFQLYCMKDRDYINRLIDRAKAANCSALVVTLDLQVLGQRHKDIKNGLAAPPRPTISNILNIATKPRWAIPMLEAKSWSFGNVVGHAKTVSNMDQLSSWIGQQFDETLTWNDLDWIKERWGGKIIVKGVLDVEDAKMAVKTGLADAIVVSNHGGRQLDGAPSAIAALPRIVDEVGDQIEVHFDSGIRSGQSVLKAIALGAKACYIGRPFIYGLGAYGQAGVTKCIEIIRKELDVSMAFTGKTNIKDVDTSILLRAEELESPFFGESMPTD